MRSAAFSPKEIRAQHGAIAKASASHGFCYFIGGSDEPEVECEAMGYACAYIGVTS